MRTPEELGWNDTLSAERTPREVYDGIKTHLTEYVETVLDRSKGKDKYCCPFCGSGTGKNKTGAFCVMPDKIHWICKVCGKRGDIFDLYANLNGTDRTETARELIRMFDRQPINKAAQRASSAYQAHKGQGLTAAQKEQNKKLVLCYQSIMNTTAGQPGRVYLMERGLTLETINKYHIGYNPAKKAVTFPHDGSMTYFSNRYIDAEKGGTKNRYEVLAGMEVPLFNPAALRTNTPCFVTEGIIDALSILQCGGNACALNGATNHGGLIAACKRQKPAHTLILALDGDEAGQHNTAELVDKLKVIDVPCIVGAINLVDAEHDINDRLRTDPEALKKLILADTAAAAGVEAKAI